MQVTIGRKDGTIVQVGHRASLVKLNQSLALGGDILGGESKMRKHVFSGTTQAKSVHTNLCMTEIMPSVRHAGFD